jgi:hypothetical protein
MLGCTRLAEIHFAAQGAAKPVNHNALISKGVRKMQTGVEQGERREDWITGAIEEQTSRAPSSLFLGLALGSMVTSAALKIAGKDTWALFVGQWAAPFLIMGNYNKMVKQHGSDGYSKVA